MADNSSIPVASGNETFANKDIAGVKFPKHISYDSSGAEVLISTETTLSALNSKIPASPATAGNQTTANSSLSSLNTVLGVKTDGKSTATDTTSVSAMSVWKQISASVQAIATSIAGTLTVGLPSGASTSANQSTGNSTLSSLLTLFGDKTDAKSTATDGTSVSVMQVLKQISASSQGATPAGTNHMGKVQIGDGTNNAVVKAASTAAAVTDPSLVVSIRPDSLKDTFAEYETVAASQTDQVMGATGASGDYLAGVLIVPGTASCGAVSIKDGSGSSISIFAGGGTTALPTLAPIFVPLGIYSTGGAWKITTGANVTVIGVGDFT